MDGRKTIRRAGENGGGRKLEGKEIGNGWPLQEI